MIRKTKKRTVISRKSTPRMQEYYKREETNMRRRHGLYLCPEYAHSSLDCREIAAQFNIGTEIRIPTLIPVFTTHRVGCPTVVS